MRWVLLIRFVASCVALAALLAPTRPAVLADAGVGELEQVVNGYSVQLVFMDALTPDVVGVHVTLTDAQGLAVRDASVQIVQSLVAELASDSHGAGGDSHGAAAAGDDHSTGAAADHAPDAAENEHSETTANDHGGEHADDGAPGHQEPAAHDEGAPHSHDDNSLYQLTWQEAKNAYTGSVIFFESGRWALHVEFVADGQEFAAEFLVDVLPPDRGGLLLAAFAGINAAIVGAAVIIKRRPAAQAGN